MSLEIHHACHLENVDSGRRPLNEARSCPIVLWQVPVPSAEGSTRKGWKGEATHVPSIFSFFRIPFSALLLASVYKARATGRNVSMAKISAAYPYLPFVSHSRASKSSAFFILEYPWSKGKERTSVRVLPSLRKTVMHGEMIGLHSR